MNTLPDDIQMLIIGLQLSMALVFTLKQPNSHLLKRLMSMYFFLLGIVGTLLYALHYSSEYWWLLELISALLIMLIQPLVFLFISKLGLGYQWSLKDLGHALPALAVGGTLLLTQDSLFTSYTRADLWSAKLFWSLFIIQTIAYVAGLILAYSKAKSSVTILGQNKLWAHLIICIALNFILLSAIIVAGYGEFDLYKVLYSLYALANLYLLVALNMTSGIELELLSQAHTIQAHKKQILSSISQQLSISKSLVKNYNKRDAKILKGFHLLMDKEKIFLNTELSEDNIAERLGISDYKLRTLVYHTYDIKCSDYINYKRIEYGMQVFYFSKYGDEPRYSDMTKALGFKSIDTFFTTFKKVTGITPIDFFEN